MQDEVVLCTRNRVADVRRLLRNLASQTRRPRLLVVDSSDGDETRDVIQAFGDSELWGETRYLRSEPGLTLQRIYGVANLEAGTEIVHFIDDDVILSPTYFEAIVRQFERDSECVGVGGWITNEPTHRPRPLGLIFGLDSHAQGRVLPSGVNTFVYELATPLQVDWLSGAAMSYRTRLFEEISFDTDMVGYCLGEDVDFSFRAGEFGTLFVTPEAGLEHLCSPVDRYDLRQFTAQALFRRHAFVIAQRSRGLSPRAFWWSVFGDVLLSAAKSIVYANRPFWRARLGGLLEGIGEIRRNAVLPE